MKASTVDKVALGMMLVLAMSSAAWFGTRRFELHESRRARVSAVPSASDGEEAVEEGGEEGGRLVWAEPVGQARGPEWCYDLFTPPEVRFDPLSGKFAVHAAARERSESEAEQLSEFRLVAVKRELFPIQLLGYVGGEGRFIGSFERADTGKLFLAAAGYEIPELHFQIEDFSVERRDVRIGGMSLPNQWAATARVRDLGTGILTSLAAGQRCYTKDLLAVLALNDDGEDAVREIRRGDEIEGASATYRVDQLDLTRATVSLVATDSASAAGERMDLTVSSDASENEVRDDGPVE
jgi:hypothetical protein